MSKLRVGPTKTFLGLTWVGWLNMLVLQWFFVRLAYGDGWCLLKWVVPLTGWWSEYCRVRPLLDWHDVLMVLLFLFAIAQICACEISCKPTETRSAPPPATQIPFKGGIAC